MKTFNFSPVTKLTFGVQSKKSTHTLETGGVIHSLKCQFIAILILSMTPSFGLAVDQGPLWKGVVVDKYTNALHKIYDDWKAGKTNIHGAGSKMPFQLGLIPTEGDDTYVGIWTRIEVHSSQENVVNVLKDVPRYISIYQDLERVKVLSSDQDDSNIEWVFGGPLGTRTIYQTIQKVKIFNPVRSALVYELKKSGKVTAADGLILIQEIEGMSYYLSIDFFNADWGSVAKLFTDTIWSDTCESTAKTTLAIKEGAEKTKVDAAVKKADSKLAVDLCSQTGDREKRKFFDKQATDLVN